MSVSQVGPVLTTDIQAEHSLAGTPAVLSSTTETPTLTEDGRFEVNVEQEDAAPGTGTKATQTSAAPALTSHRVSTASLIRNAMTYHNEIMSGARHHHGYRPRRAYASLASTQRLTRTIGPQTAGGRTLAKDNDLTRFTNMSPRAKAPILIRYLKKEGLALTGPISALTSGNKIPNMVSVRKLVPTAPSRSHGRHYAQLIRSHQGLGFTNEPRPTNKRIVRSTLSYDSSVRLANRAGHIHRRQLPTCTYN